MRYLIRFEANLDAGSKIDRSKGGPGGRHRQHSGIGPAGNVLRFGIPPRALRDREH